MASVSSLDQDMRKLRLSRYTETTANEARAWIEDTLGHSLADGDLLRALKDGVALCELANLVLPAPGIKYKKSAMPFVQMENISHFLRACEAQPLGLPAHDRFLTVDLYESKDPAQVLQCLGAFSRRANAVNPARFRHTIGPRKAGVMSPVPTGHQIQSAALQSSTRAMSPSITGGSSGSRNSTTQSPAQVSSWSTKADQGSTAPAWNPVMYGFMGGADQAKQGVSFGARRQITSASPQVPSLADKERKRKEKDLEQERLRQEQSDEAHRREMESLQQEQEAKQAEEQRWEEESRRLREQEREHLERQKQEWEEQERKWKEEEETRRLDENASLQTVKRPPDKPRTPSGNILRGQTLSQYQKEQASQPPPVETPEQARVRELEKQLAEAREREKQYQVEREERSKTDKEHQPRPESFVSDRPQTAQSGRDSGLSWTRDEREHIQRPTQTSEDAVPSRLSESTTVADVETLQPPQPPESEQPVEQVATPAAVKHDPPTTSKPFTSVRSPFARPANRTDSYLSSNAAPVASAPRISSVAETGDTAREQSSLRDQRIASQQKTQAGAWASKSLLEREMERERERQREWQEGQDALKNAPRDASQGTGPAQTWDVNQYGYMGGDGQNRGSSSGSGIAMGGRRQIIGPRPQP